MSVSRSQLQWLFIFLSSFPQISINIGLSLLGFHNDLCRLKPYHKLSVDIYVHHNVNRKQLLITSSLALTETPLIRKKKKPTTLSPIFRFYYHFSFISPETYSSLLLLFSAVHHYLFGIWMPSEFE